ncbi:hypothetical protein FS749_008736 [Ceratobasidium sp. UAMH 11750]|nr:hypothetical protein FS749_008736 [Ceratobasidium sp. UAMH 11750]
MHRSRRPVFSFSEHQHGLPQEFERVRIQYSSLVTGATPGVQLSNGTKYNSSAHDRKDPLLASLSLGTVALSMPLSTTNSYFSPSRMVPATVPREQALGRMSMQLASLDAPRAI